MKNRVSQITVVFIVILVIMFIMSYVQIGNMHTIGMQRQKSVIFDEIEYLTKNDEGISTVEKQLEELKKLDQNFSSMAVKKQCQKNLLSLFAISMLYLMVVFSYISLQIIRPFIRLEKYAQQIAEGNLDVKLQYERKNFFGAFTWAFDHMREELTISRMNEKKAIEDNKTIIATLSHDIKTPISSIRAYSEALEAGLDTSYEKRQGYLNIIINKCDEVTKLTNDLVQHSLSELDKLEILSQQIQIHELLLKIFHDFNYSQINMELPFCEAEVMVDKKRMAQVIGNIIGNAQKYAPQAHLSVRTELGEREYIIYIKDNGPGIPPEDMPFIFDKFYRGHNAQNCEGSGLGLYIVKYILNKMEGEIELINKEDGLLTIIRLKRYISRKNIKS